MTIFFIKRLYSQICYNNNNYSTTAKTYLRHAIFYNCSEIAIDNVKN